MHLTQRYNHESVLLLFNLVCRSIVYHSSCYSLMNNGTWKPGDTNDLNEQKNSSVTYGNGFAVRNEYDPLGQLIRANDKSDTTAGTDGTTWTYEYDCGGNILSKSRYVYTPGTLGTAQETVTYSYTDANWRDKLTGITTTNITGTTAKSISYDVIGNPLNDGEWTYTWENGRQLKEMSRGIVGQAGYMKVEYRYNSEGLRIQKIVTETTGSGTTATTTDYILHGKNIVHMIQGGDQLHFFYDASNRPAIVEFNGTKYGYIHDLQGDIVGIIDSAGTEVVKYTYDAWGKKLAVSGALAGSLGVINPFRYRGYVYDVETGLYYLRSRYCKPEWCRFVSADVLIKGSLYCYCKDDPVGQTDADGLESYNRCLAVGYAHNWAKGRNKNYYSYSDRGGDCANYVSQCLFEGGIPMSEQWYSYRTNHHDILGILEALNHNWAYDYDNSLAWRSASDLYNYLSDNYSTGMVEVTNDSDLELLIRNNNIRIGDTMFFDADADGIPNHATIISMVLDNEIGYSAHTESRSDEPIGTFFKQHPSGKIYTLLMKDCFN